MFYLIVLIHLSGIFITLIGVFFYWQILILQCIVIISWIINQNRCILTQLEDYYFGTTLIEVFYHYNPNNRYLVPKFHRYILYTSFTIGIFYHYKNYLINYIWNLS